jgi:sugar-specific transcriptional regulator TrmB
MQTALTKPTTIPRAFSGCGLEGAEVLIALGLAGRQARVYLATLRCECGRVKEIAEFSNVHRQEVYRLLEDLMAYGLVRRNISVPATFSATPIDEGVRLLLQHKTGQISAIKEQAKGLIKKYSQLSPLHSASEVKPCFGTIHEADRGKTYLNAIKTSHQTIDAVVSWRRFKQLSIHFENQLQTALKQDVAIRIFTEKPLDYKLPRWVKGGARFSNFQIKTAADAPVAGVMIFDRAQVAIAYNPNSSLKKGPDLWTTHPALIATHQSYFNTVWAE